MSSDLVLLREELEVYCQSLKFYVERLSVSSELLDGYLPLMLDVIEQVECLCRGTVVEGLLEFCAFWREILGSRPVLFELFLESIEFFQTLFDSIASGTFSSQSLLMDRWWELLRFSLEARQRGFSASEVLEKGDLTYAEGEFWRRLAFRIEAFSRKVENFSDLYKDFMGIQKDFWRLESLYSSLSRRSILLFQGEVKEVYFGVLANDVEYVIPGRVSPDLGKGRWRGGEAELCLDFLCSDPLEGGVGGVCLRSNPTLLLLFSGKIFGVHRLVVWDLPLVLRRYSLFHEVTFFSSKVVYILDTGKLSGKGSPPQGGGED
ncbi:MAG: hypothetical protein D6805_06220 [Planctomycetota bacterium]|nr:MAG: hypothetical protein D6805_06220 [Planctomycetota bacterium]